MPASPRSARTVLQVVIVLIALGVGAGVGVTHSSLPRAPGTPPPAVSPIGSGSAPTASGSFLTNCQGPDGPVYDSEANKLFIDCPASATVAVVSATTGVVLADVPVGYSLNPAAGRVPTGLLDLQGMIVYAPGTGKVFVSNTGSNNVSVISDSTSRLITTIDVGQYPGGMGYDSGKSQLFVADWYSNNVSVISNATDQVVTTIPVGTGPDGVVYDPSNGEIFVTNSNSGTVDVISDATDRVIATISLNGSPLPPVYDSSKGEVFVVVSDSVVVISAATNTIVATVQVGTSPEQLVYDSGKGEVFVSNTYSANVSVISDSTNALVATIPTSPYPFGLTYDAGKGELLLQSWPRAFEWNANESIISDATNQVVASLPDPFVSNGATYDPDLNELLVTNPDANNVSIISDLTNTVVGSIQLGTTEYLIVCTETGLPAGAGWGLSFSLFNGQSTDASWLSFTEPNGTYNYTTWSDAQGFGPAEPAGALHVEGTPLSVSLLFVPVYNVTFTASGLATHGVWSLVLNGTVSLANGKTAGPYIASSGVLDESQFTAQLPNGTFGYEATAQNYTAISGTVRVHGPPVSSIALNFLKAPSQESATLQLWEIAGIVLLPLAVLVGVVLTMLHGKGLPPTRPPTPPP
jgi:YVTN family beta-propeller protein